MDLALWQKYLDFLDQLGNTLDQLTEIERNKTVAVTKGDLNAVDGCMKQEQVLSLSLRGMDQKREKMLGQLGLSGVSLNDLAEKGPRESFVETKAAVEKLRRKYEVFQSASEVARHTLECNLRAIENLQKAKDAPPLASEHGRADFLA